jgi:hypothetical protein
MRVARNALALCAVLFTGFACQDQPAAVDPAEDPALAAALSAKTDIVPLPFWTRGVCCIDGYAAVIFYVNDPSTVPADYDILSYFDPRARGGDPSVSGFGHFTGASVPEYTHLKGLGAVPIWFQPASAIPGLLADGVLNVPEVEAATTFKGVATVYNELLWPVPGGSPQPKISVTARGELETGGTFRFNWNQHINPVTGANDLRAQIVFDPS